MDIGAYAKKVLMEEPNLSNEEVLKKVKDYFREHEGRETRTQVASIAWYKAKLRKEGELPRRGFEMNFQKKDSAPQARTIEVVKKELEEAQGHVLALEEELEQLNKAVEEQEKKMLQTLLEKYGSSLLASTKSEEPTVDGEGTKQEEQAK